MVGLAPKNRHFRYIILTSMAVAALASKNFKSESKSSLIQTYHRLAGRTCTAARDLEPSQNSYPNTGLRKE